MAEPFVDKGVNRQWRPSRKDRSTVRGNNPGSMGGPVRRQFVNRGTQKLRGAGRSPETTDSGRTREVSPEQTPSVDITENSVTPGTLTPYPSSTKGKWSRRDRNRPVTCYLTSSRPLRVRTGLSRSGVPGDGRPEGRGR